MKNLIIYAHPKTGGSSEHALKLVKNRLKDYEVLDLYDMKYDPVLHEDEHYTHGNHNVSDQNKEIQEKIRKAKNLIFIYPTWWNGVPAILKGFFDRVLTRGYAFNFTKKGMPIGHLKGKKAILITPTGGPRLFYLLFLRDRGAKIIAKDTLKFCGINTRYFYIPRSNRLTEDHKKRIKKIVTRALDWVV